MRAFAAFAFFLFSSTAWCQVELIKDINTSGSSCMSGFTEMNGSLYFATNDAGTF